MRATDDADGWDETSLLLEKQTTALPGNKLTARERERDFWTLLKRREMHLGVLLTSPAGSGDEVLERSCR
jgi:hypothetical protein